MQKPIYDHSSAPAFYKALSMYRMAQDGDVKFTYEKSITAYKEFLKENPGSAFLSAHKIEIAEYKTALKSYAKSMHDIGKADISNSVIADINYLFHEDVQ